MIVDGRAVADDIYGQLSARRKAMSRTPRLGILVTGEDPITNSFVKIKTEIGKRLGVDIVRVDMQNPLNTEAVLKAVQKLALECDGMIVQLPLPKNIDTNAALSAIPDDKDVDGISTATGQHLVEAPVALAVVEILRRSDFDPKDKRAIVVGAGRLVGAPTASLLKKLGAEVSFFTLEQGSIHDLKTADIIVCGAGNPGFIKPEHLKKGVALVDAGASEQDGKVVGDADPKCAEVASVFTPVPGGVGPVAVAMIFKNLFDLMEHK